ncbi:MAG TPA: tripartite tricarboxylate transporter substrate binding protein [Steroidobacteraceae bacterium]|nr:tripartite tricarboxylate transporter substrate binding protein [Steroidobacteraceae bacterium]
MQLECRSRFAAAFVIVSLIAMPVPAAWSQIAGTVRVILPFPPGGPADAMARLLAEQVGAAGGPAMVVESHPGAGTEIGTEYVSRAAPDGNTLAVISNSFVVLPHLRKLNYDPLTDFAPICELASFPPLIVVNNDSPYHTLADLIDAAHARPGALTLGSLGPATSSQLAFEMLKHEAKADITFVPFNGYTLAIQAVLGNQITAALADLSSLQGQLQTGKLRALATTAPNRIALLPDVPTVAESGYKGFEAEFFGGLVAPAKTPQPAIAQLIGDFTAAMQSPQIKAKFAALGFFPAGQCGADFAAILHKEYDKYGRIVQDAHIKME